jgi:hypothetical protein
MWNNFQRAQKGSGYSKKELSQLYKRFRGQTGGGKAEDLAHELAKVGITASNIDEMGLDVFTDDRVADNEHDREINYNRLSVTCYQQSYGMEIYNGPSLVAGPYSYSTLDGIVAAIKNYTT